MAFQPTHCSRVVHLQLRSFPRIIVERYFNMIFDQKFGCLSGYVRKSVLGKGNSQCEGHEVGMCSAF